MIPPSSKVKAVSELRDLLRDAREAGRTVVFANGCFDLVHVGHIRYLQAARALGDILVVGLNSDDSVRTLKGPGRPLQEAAERAEILASLECVDYVVLFDEERVDNLLLGLRPDIHAKGRDYTPESVPERRTVLSYGGDVAVVGDPKDHSTRDLIERILIRFRT